MFRLSDYFVKIHYQQQREEKEGITVNKKERVDAALRGDQVDRVPASMWGHDFEREWNPHSLAEAMVENFTRYDWDYMKVNPRASYHVEGWGVKVHPSREKYKAPIFWPLGIAKYLVGNKSEPVLQTIHEDRSAMHTALRAITETFINYAIACLEEGASGIFYATNGWATEGMLTADQYREFGEQYDLEFLDAIKSRSKFNILHNCGSHIYFDLLETYPVQAINWAATLEGNPDLREGKLRSDKAVMGGISEKTVLKNGSPEQVREEVEKALELTGGRFFLLAPGCSLPPETPPQNLFSIRSALS